MNWERYLAIKQERRGPRTRFYPENQAEAKAALALGILDISDYVELSLAMEPLIDSVHDPDPNVRKETIRKIAERKTPFSVQTLLRLLEDENEEVRLFAALELDRIEGEMHQRIYQLRGQLRSASNPFVLRSDLAKAYIEYAELLLRSRELRSFFLRKAVQLLDQNLQEAPQDTEGWYYRGRARLLMEDYLGASEDLRRVIRLDRHFYRAYFLLSEIYFKLGRFNLVKQIMENTPIREAQAVEIEVRLLWADGETSPN